MMDFKNEKNHNTLIKVGETKVTTRKYINNIPELKTRTSSITKSQLVARAMSKRTHGPRRKNATYAKGPITLRVVPTQRVLVP